MSQKHSPRAVTLEKRAWTELDRDLRVLQSPKNLPTHSAYAFGLMSQALTFAGTIRKIASTDLGSTGPLLRALFERVVRLQELAMADNNVRPTIAAGVEVSNAKRTQRAIEAAHRAGLEPDSKSMLSHIGASIGKAQNYSSRVAGSAAIPPLEFEEAAEKARGAQGILDLLLLHQTTHPGTWGLSLFRSSGGERTWNFAPPKDEELSQRFRAAACVYAIEAATAFSAAVPELGWKPATNVLTAKREIEKEWGVGPSLPSKPPRSA